MARILIIDDEENIRSTLKTALERRGHQVVTAANLAEGERFAQSPFDVALLDVMLPDGNGIDLLKKIKKSDPDRKVIMISGHADIDTAVAAIRLGAYDFMEKPLTLDRVLITIDNAGATTSLETEKKRLTSRLYGDFVGDSPHVQKLKQQVAHASGKTDRFLILGDSGTGKELVAHMIHQSGQFAAGPFVAVNCAALPSELVESELFGHTQGAFTGATRSRRGRFVEADVGTIFLDEISEMPSAAQAKILRVLETREITPVGGEKVTTVTGNVIAASNKDLEELIKRGLFRQDLYYRLNVVQFRIPPLSERRDDIPVLASHFLKRFAQETGDAGRILSDGALKILSQLEYPGNVRELKNLIERLNIYCESESIDEDQLLAFLPSTPTSPPSGKLKEAVEQFETDYIRAAIERTGGNVTKAAKELGLERSHLYKKMKRNHSKPE